MVHGVQTLDDGVRLLDAARRTSCRKVVIVGGGYIGIEMAEAFIRWGAAVTLIEGNEQLMRTFDADMAEPIAARHAQARRRRAPRRPSPRLRAGSGRDRRRADRCRSRRARPRRHPQLRTGGRGGHQARCAPIDPGRPPAADLARRRLRRRRLRRVVPPGQPAAGPRRARHRRQQAGPGRRHQHRRRLRLVPGRRRHRDHQGLLSSRWPAPASTKPRPYRNGFAYESVTIESTTRAGYFPDTKPITIKLLAEHGSRRVIGAQIVGEEGAAKRIDVLATAITAGMTVDDMIDLDLAYAPPFSGRLGRGPHRRPQGRRGARRGRQHARSAVADAANARPEHP